MEFLIDGNIENLYQLEEDLKCIHRKEEKLRMLKDLIDNFKAELEENMYMKDAVLCEKCFFRSPNDEDVCLNCSQVFEYQDVERGVSIFTEMYKR